MVSIATSIAKDRWQRGLAIRGQSCNPASDLLVAGDS
jgi:hypothetical protein